MRFRITSLTSNETGPLLNDITVRIEDWLNAAIGDGKFGEGVEQFTIVLVSVDDQKDENERWAKGHNKLGRYRNPATSEPVRFLSIAVPILPSHVTSLEPNELLADVCRRAISKLSARPHRVPTGFEFERCAAAVSAALGAYVADVT